jgi:hypothetical protein
MFDRETNKLTLLPDTVFYMEGGELKSTTPVLPGRESVLKTTREMAVEALSAMGVVTPPVSADITAGYLSNLAWRKETPSLLLAVLADDEDEVVRMSVARNPNTPIDALIKLANTDESIVVRSEVASNPSTPSDVLAKLAEDDSILVSTSALASLHKPANRHDEEAPALTADREKAMEAAPKQPLLAKIGDVEITPEQRLALQRGERIVLSNVRDKKGTVHDTVYVTFDRKTNKLKLQQGGKVQQAKPDVKHVKPLPKKVDGLKM